MMIYKWNEMPYDEHLDWKKSFKEFVKRVPKSSMLIVLCQVLDYFTAVMRVTGFHHKKGIIDIELEAENWKQKAVLSICDSQQYGETIDMIHWEDYHGNT